MARLERDFASAGARDRQQAIACYLSAGEGWDEAMKELRGAFAADAAQAVRSSAANGDKRDINHRASEYLQWPGLKPADSDNV